MNQKGVNAIKVRPAWVAAWVVLTIAAVLVHGMTWVGPDALDAGLSRAAEMAFAKRSANALDTVVGPIWLAMSLLTGDWGVYSIFQSFIANGLAVGALLFGIALARRWRRRLRGQRVESVNLSRRAVLADASLLSAAAIGGVVVVDGAFVEPFRIRVRRYQVPLWDLPESMSGLRAVFLSDTHLGPRIPATYVASVVEQAISMKPDLVLLGGDYVHAGSRYIRPAVELFKPLMKADIPTIAVSRLVQQPRVDLGVPV
jgi:hypothetical protein